MLKLSVNPLFGLRHLTGTVDVINEEFDILFSLLENKIPKEGSYEIDISPVLARFTLDVMAKSAFGHDVEALSNENNETVRIINKLFNGLDRRLNINPLFLGYWKYFYLAEDWNHFKSFTFLEVTSSNLGGLLNN